MRSRGEDGVAGGHGDGTGPADEVTASVVPDTGRQDVLVEAARRLGPDPRFAGVDDDELADRVCTGAARIAAATARWLQELAELVVRGVWAQDGASTPASWLSWACGMHTTTAREHVRVALRMRECPLLTARFVAGELSYSKVRALTRVATPETEAMLSTWADDATAAQLARVVTDTRRLQRAAEAPPVRDDLGVQRRWREDGTFELVLRCGVATGIRIEKDLDRLDELDDSPERPAGTTDDEQPDEAAATRPTRAQREVHAIAAALSAAVTAAPEDTSGADRTQVVLHVPAELLLAAATHAADQSTPEAAETGDDAAGNESDDAALPVEHAPAGAPPVPAALVRDGRGRVKAMSARTLWRLACTAGFRGIVTGTDGDGGANPADLGRTRRAPDARLRRLLRARDGSCRFPGCGATRNLHAHHVRWWSEDGPTDLANLVLLCHHHHGVVHERGWTLRPAGVGRWTFHPPADHRLADGSPWPASYRPSGAPAGAVLQAIAAHAPDVGPTSLRPHLWDGTTPGYDLAVGVLLERTIGTAA